jgi:hypothetical protein
MIHFRHLPKEERDKVAGTYLQGEIEIDYDTLYWVFDGDGYKTDAEWELELRDERDNVEEVVTIYNYKDGKNYCGDEGWPIHLITDWHIGGHTKSAYLYLVDYLKKQGVSLGTK